MGEIPLWIGLPKYSFGIFKKQPPSSPRKKHQKTTNKQKTIEKENSSAKIVLITICLI